MCFWKVNFISLSLRFGCFATLRNPHFIYRYISFTLHSTAQQQWLIPCALHFQPTIPFHYSSCSTIALHFAEIAKFAKCSIHSSQSCSIPFPCTCFASVISPPLLFTHALILPSNFINVLTYIYLQTTACTFNILNFDVLFLFNP